MTEKVTKLALTSRVILLVFQCLSNFLIKDHSADVFRAVVDNTLKTTWLDKTIDACLGGLRHWDGEYYLHIAEYGYTYENTLAFYPLYPIFVGSAAQMLHRMTKDFLNLRSCCLLIAVGINIIFYVKAANLLYQLTLRIFNDISKSWHAALLFCFNPASIFFTAAYSESLFALLTFYVMLESVTEIRFARSTLMLSLSFIARSNGLINFIFPIYFLMRRTILHAKHSFVNIIKLALIVFSSLIPLTLYNFYTYQNYCDPLKGVNHAKAIVNYAHQKNYVLAGHRLHSQSPWCDAALPFPYSYIQSHYWNVGFFRYYQFKQLPNFLLALPVLSFLMWHCFLYIKHFAFHLLVRYPFHQVLKEYKTFPFVIHAIFLNLVCVCFVHIQISTRLLCSATPCLYWFAADYLPKTCNMLRLRSRGSLIITWFTAYYIVGCILFSNNLPWT